MTKRDLLRLAEAIEADLADRISRGEDGSYVEYLHHKANAYRARAVEAADEEPAHVSESQESQE